tara:strand:+ start:2781 stop:2930 length:150 start_codon:yes stop_codon:yes gene_type:complete
MDNLFKTKWDLSTKNLHICSKVLSLYRISSNSAAPAELPQAGNRARIGG